MTESDYKEQRPTGCQVLAELLKETRLARDLSQRRLARLASDGRPAAVTRNTVALWENGHRRISAEDLARIESALQVDLVGVDRTIRSPHHPGNWCQASLGAHAVSRTGGHLP